MNENIQQQIQLQARKAKSAMRLLSRSSADVRNHALLAMAESLQDSKDKIQAANRIDLENGEKTGLAAPLLQRLLLDDKKIERMVDNLRQVAALPDPIGAVISMGERPNGLKIGTVRVPIGVVAVVYESRPDVTVEVSALCIKSGTVLSSEAVLKRSILMPRLRVSSVIPLLQKVFQMPYNLWIPQIGRRFMSLSVCQSTLTS